MQGNIYSVSKLNDAIKNLLETNPPFRNIFVQGEISNYKPHSSGHHYLTLKDDGAAINAVMFRSDASRLRFRLENGMKVIARGRISSFPKTGQVQLYVADMMPDGAGALHMAFEQLKAKLYTEGLFDTARKRSLPRLPQTIALITSPTGAAVHDMLRILARRWPLAQIELHPALVQGADAPLDLCRALREANERGHAQLILMGRGGGSIEDLWAFNDERVARAIYASKIPVVSAVGHEPDVTIADFVADLRAPTPSAAAEMVTPDREEVRTFFMQVDAALQRSLYQASKDRRRQLDMLTHRLGLRSPQHLIEERRLLLSHVTEKLLLRSPQYLVEIHRNQIGSILQNMRIYERKIISEKRNAFTEKMATLDALSPLKVLARGYSAVFDAQGKAVTDSGTLQHGDLLDMRFAKGAATCIVKETRKGQ